MTLINKTKDLRPSIPNYLFQVLSKSLESSCLPRTALFANKQASSFRPPQINVTFLLDLAQFFPISSYSVFGVQHKQNMSHGELPPQVLETITNVEDRSEVRRSEYLQCQMDMAQVITRNRLNRGSV